MAFFYVPLTKASLVEWVLDPAPLYVPLGKWEIHGLRYEPAPDEDLTGIVITDFSDLCFTTRFIRQDTPVSFAMSAFEETAFFDMSVPAILFKNSPPIPRQIDVPTGAVSLHLRVSAPLHGKFLLRVRLAE